MNHLKCVFRSRSNQFAIVYCAVIQLLLRKHILYFLSPFLEGIWKNEIPSQYIIVCFIMKMCFRMTKIWLTLFFFSFHRRISFNNKKSHFNTRDFIIVAIPLIRLTLNFHFFILNFFVYLIGLKLCDNIWLIFLMKNDRSFQNVGVERIFYFFLIFYFWFIYNHKKNIMYFVFVSRFVFMQSRYDIYFCCCSICQ